MAADPHRRLTPLLRGPRGFVIGLALGAGAGLAVVLLPPWPAAPPPGEAPRRLAEAGFGALPGWEEDGLEGALPALLRSCERAAGLDPAAGLGGGGLGGTAGGLGETCAALAALDGPAGLRALLEERFVPVEVRAGREREGLFTGYFEPELRGAPGPEEGAVPLYRRPPELVETDLGLFREGLAGTRLAGRVEDGRLVPMPDRAAIHRGALDGRGLELAWVEDRTEAFFLHIQGSGRVRYGDGRVLRVGYAGANGHPYRSIGRLLVERGEMELEEVSLGSLVAWLRANPGKAGRLLEENPSYVFFRELEGEGPMGAAGVAVTPGRTLAVDPRHVPYHLPVWVATEAPVPGGETAPYRRLMVAQDTGGAIRGPVRGDVFFGHGPAARERAGRMRAMGRIWILVPREAWEAFGDAQAGGPAPGG